MSAVCNEVRSVGTITMIDFMLKSSHYLAHSTTLERYLQCSKTFVHILQNDFVNKTGHRFSFRASSVNIKMILSGVSSAAPAPAKERVCLALLSLPSQD